MSALLQMPAGRIADTGGFTDLVFAAAPLLGYMFIPRIREAAIIANWPDILRTVATMMAGRTISPSVYRQR